MNQELPDVQAGFRKAWGTRDQIANIRWIIVKARELQKNIYFCLIDYAQVFNSVDHNTLWKILKEKGIPDHLPGFSNTWTVNFQMFKLGLEKAEEPEIKLPTSGGSLKKQESSRKTSISALLTMPKPLTVWITINCGKFWKRWEYQTTWSASWEICMQVRKQQLEVDMEQQTGSK